MATRKKSVAQMAQSVRSQTWGGSVEIITNFLKQVEKKEKLGEQSANEMLALAAAKPLYARGPEGVPPAQEETGTDIAEKKPKLSSFAPDSRDVEDFFVHGPHRYIAPLKRFTDGYAKNAMWNNSIKAVLVNNGMDESTPYLSMRKPQQDEVKKVWAFAVLNPNSTITYTEDSTDRLVSKAKDLWAKGSAMALNLLSKIPQPAQATVSKENNNGAIQ